ncbi:hypothetical protein Tco_0952311 [Tanacetum coccineum]|uniref:Uncharacterized protein n=1 Tax=Tanacetum coccineum TaxID=301880 RepID=A0ABQ5DWL5_9ASTR
MIAVNNQKDSVSPPLLSAKPKKGNTQTMTSTLPSHRALRLLEHSLRRDKSLSTAKTTSRPKRSLGDKGSRENKLPADMEPINPTVADLSGTGAKYQVDQTQSTRLRYQSLTINKGKTSYEVEPDTKPLQLQTFADEPVRKAEEQARLLDISKHEVIKVVQEEAEKIGLDPKKIATAKAGEKFKKAQDAEHQVLKREHSKKVKTLTKLNKRRDEEYMWIMTNRIKPEPITDVKIHPNTKPVVVSVYMNNDKRNFDVHNPFKFTDFGTTELDELGPII